MFKFQDIGTYKNAVNVGYCVASVEMHNGQVVEFDVAKKIAKLPTNEKAAGLAVVMNSIEKPEILSPNEYVIEVGEYPRLFTLDSLKSRVVEMDMDQVSGAYSAVDVGKFLVPTKTGKLEVVSDASGYAEYFEVTALTSFNGEGIEAVVKTA